MKAKMKRLYQGWYSILALLIAAASLTPLLATHAYAYGQVSSRSIEMSSAAAGATSTTYTIKFTTATAGVIEGIVINFCDNNPLISASCTYTSGQSIGLGSASFTSIAGTPDTTVGASNWLIGTNSNSATAGNGVILALTDSNAAENSSIAASTAITIVISGITNPNYTTCGSPDTHPNCTFYARILTYTTPAGATGYASGTIGSPTDAGGDALSTTSSIAITANVMEQLTFCVSGNSALVSGGAHGCSNAGDVTNPAITIGHGSGTLIIDSSAVDVNSAYTQLSTNASTGANVRMKASNSCANAGLSSNGGSTCNIQGIGSTATAMVAGTTDFGMCVIKGTNTTVTATYNDTAHNCNSASPNTWVSGELFGMGPNVTTTYGDSIFTTASAVSKENNTLTFAATAGATVPAGIYTANESLIATGTF